MIVQSYKNAKWFRLDPCVTGKNCYNKNERKFEKEKKGEMPQA